MPREFEKKSSILQVGGPSSSPSTPLINRVVLLHTEEAVKDVCPDTVYAIQFTIIRALH